VQITAERPDTLDLLRRHLPDLARDLREMGHASLSFSFAQSGGDAPQRQPQPAPAQPAAAEAERPPAPAARPFAAAALRADGDRLDLRL
jgi:flagellar hook-length control protein FliK